MPFRTPLSGLLFIMEKKDPNTFINFSRKLHTYLPNLVFDNVLAWWSAENGSALGIPYTRNFGWNNRTKIWFLISYELIDLTL